MNNLEVKINPKYMVICKRKVLAHGEPIECGISTQGDWRTRAMKSMHEGCGEMRICRFTGLQKVV